MKKVKIKELDEVKETNSETEIIEDEELLDDEAVIKLQNEIQNDKVIEKYSGAGLFDQDENLISYNIKGLYKDNSRKNVNRRSTLKSTPPVLVFSNSNGDNVEIILTQNLTQNLSQELKIVENAYYGINKVEKKDQIKVKDIPTFIDKFILNQPAKLIGTIILILIVIMFVLF